MTQILILMYLSAEVVNNQPLVGRPVVGACYKHSASFSFVALRTQYLGLLAALRGRKQNSAVLS